MKTHEPTIIVHGPIAQHDMACPVYFKEQPAVLELGEGVFHPSWRAQQHGWRLVQAKNWFQRLVLRVAFNGPGDSHG